MYKTKLLIVFAFAVFIAAACASKSKGGFVITGSPRYEASLFRQNCAICHGPEGNGRVLDNGTKVPSLREGEFKAKTEAQISNQIANGGNGMVAFRNQLSQRELQMMTQFVLHDLRGQ
jgi:cytochrome c553